MAHRSDKEAMKRRLMPILVFAAAVVVMIALAAGTTALAGTSPQTKGTATNPNYPQSVVAVPAVQEGFEGSALNYTQFQNAIPTCVPGGCGWDQVTSDHHTGAQSVFARDVNGTGDQQIVLNNPVSIPADATSASLTFWQRYDFEANGTHHYDGGVFEVSTDGGANWADGGSLITAGAYNVTLEPGTTNPLAARQAWGGTTSGAWEQVQANLLAYKGRNFLFRLRLGTDASNAGFPIGWWVDDVLLSYLATAPCAPAGWLQAAPYPTIMADVAAASLDDQVFAFGGLNGNINSASYHYNPATNTWTPIAPLPAARYYASASTDGTYIYVIGGRDASINPVNTVYRYDPIANNYSTLAPLSDSVFEPGVAVLNGKLYRIGGSDAAGIVSSVEAYSLANHTWTPVAPLPQTGAGQAVIAYGNYLYVAGGITGAGSATAKTYRYDPANNTWDDAAIADLPLARAGMAATLFNGRFFIAAGLSNATGYLSSALAWDPSTNTWASRAQLPAPWGSGPGVSAAGNFYLVAGVDAGSYIRTTVRLYTEGVCLAPTATPTRTATPTPTSCPIQFSDVPQGSTFYENIRCLACRGIISGYPDGSFKPNNNVTRGQLSKIVSNAAGFLDNQSTQLFQDVSVGSTFFQFIGRLASRGFIGGYPCGGAGEPCGGGNLPYFRPGNNASRGQISKIVSNTAGYSDGQPNQLFQDVPLNSTFQLYIGRLASRGYMNGYPCGGAGEACVPPGNLPYFRPGNNATRGQTAKIVGNTFFPNCQTPDSPK